MPTRTEAAEALYRAVERYHDSWKGPGREDLGDLGAMFGALVYYESAPPDAPPSLPPAVQRVVEAAMQWRSGDRDVAAVRALCAAVDAYRSSQPEPLSARLAKLKAGSVVEDEDGVEFLVFANHTLSRTLVCDHADGSNGEPMLVPYERVATIIYESP